MNLNELRNIDLQNVGSWPSVFKAFVILLLCAAVIGSGFWFVIKPQLEVWDREQENELALRTDFENKQRQAASLEPLKRQLEEMKLSLGALLRLLPNKTEIEGLLVDISQAGLASGLEFELFKPGAEQKQEFIATLPISIQVTGTYHEFAEFISAVAALPRIVTQHDIEISPASGKKSAADKDEKKIALSMRMTARTYRYLEEDEIEEEADKGSKKKRRRR